MVNWYKCKLKEISEAPVDSRPRKLRKLYQFSEANKDLGVTITKFGTLTPVDYLKYPPELELHEYENNKEDVFYDTPIVSSSIYIYIWFISAGYKPYIYIVYICWI